MKRNSSYQHIRILVLPFFLFLLLSCGEKQPQPGQVLDEARRAGRTAQSFPAGEENYFQAMDGGIALTTDEVKGRNTWIVWSGGNDRFWDALSKSSVGNLDFLKTLSTHPKLKKFSRDNRWNYLGLVNEPCFEKATGPDPKRFGLWLDKRRADCPADPFEDEKKYPGVAIGARGKNLPVGSFYGYASGIVGLRLFPNPDFDEAAAKKWDPVKYYEDPEYYFNKDLVKPYRVGMSCGFCHVGPNPIKPPADPENPKWENLSSNVGAQYFWVDRIFTWEADETSFAFQLFHTSRPGALDTSLVSTDYINNPRTMNAVYGLGPRMEQAKRRGKETLSNGGLDNMQFQDFVKDGPLTQFFQKPDTVWTPRVLKDGSDSVGALGALNRVYLNIGLFSEEWMLHFNALVGGKPTSPIKIADARKNSAYWQATEQQTFATALFFLKSTAPHRLKDAPGGAKYLTQDKAVLTRGKVVFAEYCARCHSSKLPNPAPGVDPGGCAGSGYLACFNNYWAWTKTPEFKNKMREIVLAENFLEDNYLSTELRIPVTLLKTNACRTTFPPSRTRTSPRSERSWCTTRSPASRASTGCRPAVEATPARHRSSACGPRRLSCRTTVSESSSRVPRSRLACGPSTTPSSSYSGPRNAGRTTCSATKSQAGSTGPRRGALSRCQRATCPTFFRTCGDRWSGTCPGSSAREGSRSVRSPRERP